jgi:trk system potassium uptake protein TrkH
MIKSRNLTEFWKDLQTRNLLFAFTIGGIILSFLLSSQEQVSEPFRVGLFQFVSAMSTTGWQTADFSLWNQETISYLIFAAMIIGGAAGSTVGGIKIIRMLMIVLGLRWQINSIFLSQHTIKIARFNGRTMLPEDINQEFSRSAGMAMFFLLLLFACAVVTSLFADKDVSFIHLLFESASAQATVGLSCGITDPSMSPVIESVYIFQMWAGRLEILPVFALFRIMFRGSKPRNI